jgi:hypothetical protein
LQVINLPVLVLLFCPFSWAEDNTPSFSLSPYLEFARASADKTWENYEDRVDRWRKSLDPENVFGYRPPSGLLEMSTIYAALYELEGKETYAERAKKVLMEYGEFREAYPEYAIKRRADYAEGVPALPDFFTTMRYIRAFETLKRLGYLSRGEQEEMTVLIAQSLDYLLRTQEWGPMNRTILRAETLAWAVRALPDHPKAGSWKTYEQALAFDNWGNWEIEDASLYNAVWLYALLGYADAKGAMEDLFRTPEMYYYAQYFLYLMCPDGMIPDFGDAWWRYNWSRFLVFFEAAAKAYQDPKLKWAAVTMADRFLDLEDTNNIGLGFLLLDAYRFGTKEIQPEAPTRLSMEVMEDMVGKKIVFRSGWTSKDTYLLLNYRDEGDGGLLFRDYLRDTIPVEEEKMTHGHADENSIVLLMHGGAVLLHDGGYRDYMPSGPFGAYRQDYFHNRLCVRQEKIFMGQEEGEYRYSTKDRAAVPGQTVLDFLRNAGSYRPVRTQKLDFLTFPDFDYTRTRLIDDDMGYLWDRVIVYVKDPLVFVIFDVMKAKREAFFTACNLWHTRKIHARGEHWYDTGYDALDKLKLPQDTHLLVYFPKTHYRLEGAEPQTRYRQEEWMIHQTAAQHFELGQHVGFVTVLVPHGEASDPETWVNRIHWKETEPAGKGLMVEIRHEDRLISLGVKRDLRMDMVRDWRRPRYTYEAGRIRYEDMETNGDFFFTDRSDHTLSYTVVNFTKAVHDGRVLYSQPPSFFGLAFDGSPDAAGIGKARYWRDTVSLNEE